MLERMARRDDVEDGERGDRVRVVQRQPVPDPRPAIVAREAESLETERAHDEQLISRRRPLGVLGVAGARSRLGAVAVTAEVGEHDGVLARQDRRDVMPDQVGLRVAVQQEERRPVPGDGAVGPDAVGVDLPVTKRIRQRNAHDLRITAFPCYGLSTLDGQGIRKKLTFAAANPSDYPATRGSSKILLNISPPARVFLK
jgi:hypothetical protein